MVEQNLTNVPALIWENTEKQRQQMNVVDRVFIGRVCQGVAHDKRIIIDSPNVSRDHAVISRMHGRLLLKDTSRNGTRINGVRVTPGSEVELHSEDKIEIGDIEIRVNLTEGGVTRLSSFEGDATRVISITETVTHLVADVRGFSGLTQRSQSKAVFDFVSDLFQLLTDVVHQHHGTVKDFAGDAIYAFWEHGELVSSQKALQACFAARDQMYALEKYLSQRAQDDPLRSISLGWGISTGAATLSHYGIRQDNLALVGDSTNLAFRLAAMANNTLADPIILCANTAKLVQEKLALTDVGAVETKGREGKEQVYGVL